MTFKKTLPADFCLRCSEVF